MNTPTVPKRQAPTLNTLKQQRTAQGPGAPQPPAPKLTPEELAKKQAQEAEVKRKEQVKIAAINKEWKDKLTDAEEAEVLDVVARQGKALVVEGVIQPCAKKRRPKGLDCVPGDPKKNTGVSQQAADAVIKAQEEKRKTDGTKVRIDYRKVGNEWEGGSYTQGYVPWGPKLEAVQKDIGEPGKPHLVTMFIPNTAHNIATSQKTKSLTGRSGNNSGVTVGAGVDFGSKDDETYRASLKKAAKNSSLLTEAEADQLADKLKPYYGLKRTEACQALRKTPLQLSQKEVDLLNYESFSSHTDGVIKAYENATKKKWGDLSEQEQTTLFAQKYHHGHITGAMAKAVGGYEPDKVLKQLQGEREYGYMKAYYAQEAAAGTPQAKAYALRQAAQAAAKTKAALPKTAADSLKTIKTILPKR